MEFFLLILLIIFLAGIFQLISLFASFFNKSKPGPHRDLSFAVLLREIIQDLTGALKKYPENPELRKLTDKYMQKTAIPIPLPPSARDTVDGPAPSYEEPAESWIVSWYSHNSVTFLLYLGAFLIVAASVTFLSFTWDSLNGFMRFFSFFSITAAFGLFGYLFYGNKRLVQAGITFIGIAALLFPLNFAAFQRFIIVDPAFRTAMWSIASVSSLALYIILFRSMSYRFYAVLMMIASLSLIESYISLASLPDDYMIFGAMITSFIWFIVSVTIQRHLSKNSIKTFDRGSHVMLIISLVLGFFLVVSKQELFTWKTTMALFLTSAYYGMRYQFGSLISFQVMEIFFLLGTLFAGYTLKLHTFQILLVQLLATTAIMYASREARMSKYVTFFSFGLLYLIMLIGNITTAHFSIIQGFMILLLAIGLIFEQEKISLALIFAGLAVFIWTFNTAFLMPVFNTYNVLPFLYLGVAAAAVYMYGQKHIIFKDIILFGVLLHSALAYFPGVTGSLSQYVFFIVSIINTVIYSYVVKKIPQKEFILLPTVAALVSGWAFLIIQDIRFAYFPFITVAFLGVEYWFAMYAASPVTVEHKKVIQYFVLGASFFLSIILLFTPERGTTVSLLSVGGIIMAAAYTTDYWTAQKVKGLGYIAGLLGVLAVLRFFYHINVENIQWYVQPISYYLIACGVYRFIHKEESSEGLLVLGMGISIFALFMNSFDVSNSRYAGYLILESIVFMSIGISLQNKHLKYGGAAGIAAAVFAQTSQYIFQLPKWLFIGLLGVIILGTAVYLLNARERERSGA